MAYERKCILCGASYKYCPHCRDFDNLPKWMTMFDKEVCREIFNAVSEYNFGKYTAAEAKRTLDQYPDEDHTLYTKITQKSIADIYEKTSKSKKRKATTAFNKNDEEKNEVIKE